MGIRWVDDLGAPALVALADIAVDEQKPAWSRPVGVGLSATGYILGGYMGIGGAFLKNVGIAAGPWAFESIYRWIREGAGVGGRVSRARMSPVKSRVTRWPAPAYEGEFEGVTLD